MSLGLIFVINRYGAEPSTTILFLLSSESDILLRERLLLL